MNVLIVKSRPDQKRQFPMLIHIVSMIPGVKNWYIESDAEIDILKIEANDEISQSKLQSILNLYQLRAEVQA